VFKRNIYQRPMAEHCSGQFYMHTGLKEGHALSPLL